MALNLSSFEQFCGNSPFWNGTLLIDSSYPAFTECFKQVGLVWIPCLALLAVSPIYLLVIKSRKKNPGRFTWLYKCKQLCNLSLLSIALATLIVRGTDDDQESIPDALYVSEALKLACILLSFVFTETERRKGLITSPVLWGYWILQGFCYIVPFYSNLKENIREKDRFGFIIFFFNFGFVFLQCIFLSFADKRTGSHQDLSARKNPTPELNASLLSQLTFWWMNGLILKGYKKTLVEDDVFDLDEVDQTRNTLPPLEQAWKAEGWRVQKKYKDKVAPKPATSSKHTSVGQSTHTADEKSPLLPRTFDSNEECKKGFAKKDKRSLAWALTMAYGARLLTVMAIKCASDLLPFATPKITEALISFVENRDDVPLWRGYALATANLAILVLQTFVANWSLFMGQRIANRISASLLVAIYKKSLTISNVASDTTQGEIVNLMSIDCYRISEMLREVFFTASMPFQIVLSIYLLWGQMGVSTLAGVAVIVAAVPANVLIGYFVERCIEKQMEFKDERVKMTTEVLNGIKILKLYAWEGSFQERIQRIRENEMKETKKYFQIMSILFYTFYSVPYMVQLAAFGTYITTSDAGYLSPTVAFVSIQLFNMLNQPFTLMPVIMPFIIESIVSVRRIAKFLCRDDIKRDVVKQNPNAENAISIEDADFSWDSTRDEPNLKNITVSIPCGQLVAVVGSVGSGKSSLLAAMLGEMDRLRGTVTMKSSVAYVPQEAWIQNQTVQNNILFSKSYKPKCYDDVIKACSLTSDLALLPAGDKTEIGEKGVNLSGGQKQRVSLARAVYNDDEIYLLDDPLSAVDSHVGKHIFKEVIGRNGLLKSKTRILVTHGIHWLPQVDSIIVLNNGTITEMGSYEELLSKGGDFAQFLRAYLQEDLDNEKSGDEDPETQAIKRSILQRVESVTGSVLSGSSLELSRSFDGHSGKVRNRKRSKSFHTSGEYSDVKRPMSRQASRVDTLKKTEFTNDDGQLIEEEFAGEGRVQGSTYMYYMKEVGLFTVFIAAILYGCYTGLSIFSGIWVSKWTGDSLLLNTSRHNDPDYDDRQNMYLWVYGGAGVGQGLFILVFSLFAAQRTTRAAAITHRKLLNTMLKAPMSFFDTTPTGRIMNRFSKDIEAVDMILPASMTQALARCSLLLTAIVTICYGFPIFLAALVPLGILYVLVQMTYIPAYRQLRRLESKTRSPLFNHFSETLNGVHSIRSYGASERFIKGSQSRLDQNMKFSIASTAASTWLMFRLQFLGGLVVFAVSMFIVTTSDVDPNIAGLCIAYASSVTGALQHMVECISEMESNIVSVERIKAYTNVQTEADWVYPNHRPKLDWPQHGQIVFDAYQTRYRPGLDLVLKDISCTINQGEKIGIVGRTGAGKSSMTLSLFRIIEAAGGQIVVDGENIASMGLHDLRSKLTILPQEPLVLYGTLRMNLDPFGNHNDQELWVALEHSYLKDHVQGLPEGLDYQCGEGGSNLSVGQRQLLCLARTILRRTKILVLDEATAAVDMETDELIQKTLKTEFRDCTVLTIAHRLNTIMDYDRIMVLSNGVICELDSPASLLSNTDGVFYGMAKDAGLV